ncbi:uracil-xanthine permease family protein [Luteimicrobium subarcticum]|uniref:Uracil-xanthine permease n=1 Tax=Luteimicrobium subarcticum TaxID=620910 RepID=A0A2M8WUZ5_9MICO|nr:solute carrier family 23 protein [Luteimicrobium subarcticum]PJI94757.1 uracil-xanthine permease [Luteimicrobium subarcticum]
MPTTTPDQHARLARWTVHGDGRSPSPGGVVAPDERLTWPRTVGIGLQHVVAMFGSTFIVPILTGFSPATTLFFSAVGTALFLVVTGNRLPSYLGSSFAFIAPILAATGSDGKSVAVGGILLTGLVLTAVGVVVQVAGAGWINRLMPPVITGTIVALIGLNLAPAAWNNFRLAPSAAVVTLAAILLTSVFFRGILGRLSILVGVLVGYAATWLCGNVLGWSTFGTVVFNDPAAPDDPTRSVDAAAWVGFPTFTSPSFSWSVVGLFVPVVLVLIAENVGHVKSVSTMTGRDLDPLIGRALLADGLATTLAGTGGGSGTTTYAENIGVMAATRIYSTAAYWVAAVAALFLSLCPKFGVLVATIPAGVLGGATTMLYGMIGILGARIWVQNRVDFGDPVNLATAAVPLVIGIADFTWKVGDLVFTGIALGTAAALVVFHLLRWVERVRGTGQEPASPASVPDVSPERRPGSAPPRPGSAPS